MSTTMIKQQRGISFGGFIFAAFLLVLVGIFALRLIPAYMQYGEIKNVFSAIAQDPEMQKATQQEIRASFSRRASIDDIKAIKAEDIQLSTDQGRLVLRASYFVLIPVAGNISLYLDFNPTSAQ